MKRYSPLLLIVVLLGALAVSQAAVASPSRPVPTFAHPTLRDNTESEEEGEAAEFEFEECEIAPGEFQFKTAEEIEEAELEASCSEVVADAEAETEAAKSGDASFVTAPVTCQIRQAESTITTLPGSDQVRLTVRYRTYAPTQVTVGLKLKDQKGSVGIEHTTKHLSGKGVLHVTTKLGSAMMERALAASEFDVSLHAPETPASCAAALEQRLHSVKHTGGRAPRVYSD
jgi:hypothetical protein